MESVAVQFTPLLIVVGMFVLLILSGLRSRSPQVSEYGFSGGYTGPVGIGASIASNWMSAASFLGMAAMFYVKGSAASAYVVGWTGGYVLLLVLMATQIRRFGKYTAPDFVGFRYESDIARTLAALISIMITVIYSAAQFRGIALLVSWLFGISYIPAVVVGASLVVGFVVVSGLLGVSRNQKIQYYALIFTIIFPLMLLGRSKGYFWLLPQFGYGEAIGELERNFSWVWSPPVTGESLFQWFALCGTLMFGTAGLPHVLSRFYVAPGIKDARWGVVWGLFFISLIYWSAPAYGVFARLFEMQSRVPLGASPMGADMALLYAAQQGGLPVWVIGLLAAGGMSAAFATVSALLLTGSASFSHDIYPRLIRPNASEQDKLYVAKGFFLCMAFCVIFLALRPWAMIAEMAALAFALAGNTIFPAFLLGIWWGRANAAGVITGMLCGIAITFAPFLLGDVVPWLLPTSSAFIGAPLVILVMIAVSLISAPVSEEVQRFLAEKVHDCTEE